MSKDAVRHMIRGESIEFIRGFKRAAKLFAYWRDGKRLCGTAGTTYKDILEAIDEEVK